MAEFGRIWFGKKNYAPQAKYAHKIFAHLKISSYFLMDDNNLTGMAIF